MDEDIDAFDDDVSIVDLRKKRKQKEDTEEDERNEEEKIREIQKLKAAIHFHTTKLAESESDKIGITISRETVAAISDIAYNFAESIGNDLYYFAQHAKRHTVQPDDVRLCARKSEKLYSIISESMTALANDAEERKNVRKEKKTDKDESTTKKKPGRPKKPKLDDDDDDDKPITKKIKATTTTTTTTNTGNNNTKRITVNDEDDFDNPIQKNTTKSYNLNTNSRKPNSIQPSEDEFYIANSTDEDL